MLILQLGLYCALFTAMVALAVRGGAVNGLYFYPKPVQERAYAIGLADREVYMFRIYRGKEIVPGHTWGHMVYLIDDAYLFTGDTIWFGADGGRSFINMLAKDNRAAVRSLEALEKTLRARGLHPKIITGHTGWTDDLNFAFAHREQVCNAWVRQKPHDPEAPYDAYDESGDTEEQARTVRLKKQSGN